jgi:ribosomal protein L40E
MQDFLGNSPNDARVEVEGGPSDELAPVGRNDEPVCRRCGSANPPGSARCWQCKSYVRGAPGHLVHSAHAAQRWSALAPALREERVRILAAKGFTEDDADPVTGRHVEAPARPADQEFHQGLACGVYGSWLSRSHSPRFAPVRHPHVRALRPQRTHGDGAQRAQDGERLSTIRHHRRGRLG